MFFIVNKTKRHITLPDINISLGPRQALDLDKIMDRAEADKSRHLRAAQSKGDIEIRIKDVENIKSTPKNSTKIEGSDIKKIKDEIIKEMKSEIKSLKNNTSNNGLSKEDLIEAMKEMMQNISTKEVIIREGKNEYISEDEIVEVDDDLLGEINKRAINKMVKNTESTEVKYKEEKQENDLDNNISELEDLLG